MSVIGSATATFYYDGDGNRVKANVACVTTNYIGNYLEWKTSTSDMIKYYYAGGMRVVERVGSTTVYGLLGDELGSTAITTNGSGTFIAELRYYPWGTIWYSNGTTPTSYEFTGQRLESSIGLYYYGARWYDPYLNRWIQPDVIIPSGNKTYSPLVVDYHEMQFLEQLNQQNHSQNERSSSRNDSIPTNSQAFDRYAYTFNNPVRYDDPTGHRNCEEDGYNCNVSTTNSTGPITNLILSLPYDDKFWNGAAKTLDSLALVTDTFAVGVVTYGGIAGAGIAAPFIAGGAPEFPVVTGLAGIGISELAIQPVLLAGNTLAVLGTFSTVIADTKSGTTNIESLSFSTTTLNSATLSTAGLLLPEAYLSFTMQSFSVANDFGLTSFPWSRLLNK